ncbi:MAG: hypothetical protein AAF789_07195 [Bacteroidota bacterium]
MKKIFYIVIAICFFACRNENLDPRPDLNDNVGAITLISNQSVASFDLTEINSSELSFDIDVDGFDETEVTSVSVQMIFTDAGRNPNPDPAGSPLDSIYDAVEISTVTSFPSTVTIAISDIVNAIPDFSSADDFFIGDNFNFIFPISTADGRILTTALQSDLCQQPAQPSFGGCNVNINIACAFVAADAEGTYTVLSHRFGDDFGLGDGSGTTREVVAGPGENQLTIVGGTLPGRGGNDLIISIDPVSGNVSYGGPPDSLQFDASVSPDGQYTNVSGTTLSCIGSIDLTVVSACCIPNFFRISKQ